MAVRLTRELVDFVESGVSILIGTRGPDLRPACTRAAGAKVSATGDRITLFVPELVSERARAQLRDVPLIAAGFSRPFDNLSVQLKGPVREVRPTTNEEQRLQEQYLAAYGEVLYLIGLPRALVRRFRLFPSVAVAFDVTDVFEQTPGPNAGRRHAIAGGST